MARFREYTVTAEDIDRMLVERGGLAEFVKQAWHLVESVSLVWEPHLELMCDHYEAVSRGECLELVVNVPPGCSKSLITNVFWPAWDWIRNGWRKWIFTSYGSHLTNRDAARCAALVMSEWYQKRWGYLADPQRLHELGIRPLTLIGKDRKKAKKVSSIQFWTSQGGMRYSTMFGGQVTGQHANILVADDPVKPQTIQGGGEKALVALETVRYRWRNVFGNRTSDAARFAKVVIMQRLHEADLAGDCIDQGYTLLRLPMRYEPHTRCVTPWGQDYRTQPGELLSPKRFPLAVTQKIQNSVSARDWASQYQQSPNPEQGSIFQRDYFKGTWGKMPANIRLIQSWDCAFKDRKDSDPVAGHIWGKIGSWLYWVDRVYGPMSLPTNCQAIEDYRAKWPNARQVVIEDAANGPAVEQTLRDRVGGIILVRPQGGKIARANAVEPYFRAGNVLLPEHAPWRQEVIEAFVKFPTGKNDHDIDAATQAVLHLEGGSSNYERLKRAMKNQQAPAEPATSDVA